MSEEVEAQLPAGDVDDKNLVISAEPVELELVEETSEENVEVAAEQPLPPQPKRGPRKSNPAIPQVYDYTGITVSIAALVYHAAQRRSLSVLAVQNRLSELGYPSAKADLGGWLSDGTRDALDEYQQSIGAENWGDAVREMFAGTDAEVQD